MSEQQQPPEAWAIKAPEGHFSWLGFILPPRLSKSEYNRGYRCVRVRVEEIAAYGSGRGLE